MPGDSLDQLSYTKKKLSERPTKKKTHYFDKKALTKGKNVQNAEVITPLEAHFESNEKILVSENEASFLDHVIEIFWLLEFLFHQIRMCNLRQCDDFKVAVNSKSTHFRKPRINF